MREVRARPVGKVATLRGATVVTLFYEQSTRTRASFEVAAKALGADVVNLTATGSSVEKGESLIDTVRTLEAIGADIVVMRHGKSGAPYLAARHTRASVINGGDGTHAHPTQALLDLFTMRRRLGSLEGKRVVIVGDVLHSRVARSNSVVAVGSWRRRLPLRTGHIAARRRSPGRPSAAAWKSPPTSTPRSAGRM